MKTYKRVIFIILMLLGVLNVIGQLSQMRSDLVLLSLIQVAGSFAAAYAWANGGIARPWWQVYAGIVAFDLVMTAAMYAMVGAPTFAGWSNPQVLAQIFGVELLRLAVFGWLFKEVRVAKAAA